MDANTKYIVATLAATVQSLANHENCTMELSPDVICTNDSITVRVVGWYSVDLDVWIEKLNQSNLKHVRVRLCKDSFRNTNVLELTVDKHTFNLAHAHIAEPDPTFPSDVIYRSSIVRPIISMRHYWWTLVIILIQITVLAIIHLFEVGTFNLPSFVVDLLPLSIYNSTQHV
jgi:hypothetical protein